MPSDPVMPDVVTEGRFDSPKSAAGLNPLKRYIPLAAWVLVILTLLAIPAKIVGYGFLPADDALRHAAKAVSGKPWQEILVMRSDFKLDPHPGWHAILGCVHRLTDWGPEGLVVFSVVSLMLLVQAAVLPWLRRPEAWLAALLACVLCVREFSARLVLGRPYLFTVAASILLLFMWSRIQGRRPRLDEMLYTILLVAAAAWIHGSFYQLILPVAVLLLMGRWRQGAWMACCWAGGSFLGSALTGHPWEFLSQSVRHLSAVFSEYLLTRQLVRELEPSDGDPLFVLAVVAMLLWRSRTPGWKAQKLVQPFFVMAVLGWVLGLKTLRFWWDWGLPAAVVWLALEFQEQLQSYVSFVSWKRLLVVGGLALGAFLAITSDYGGRWTWNLTNVYLTQDNPELAGWLPDKGGTIYSSDMRVFNDTFFKNPTAPWRYVLGFEPALMRTEDLDVYRSVQWTYGSVRAYEPWVRKMRTEDRMILRAGGKPLIPELEWHYGGGDLWLGRLPHQTNSPAPVP